MNPFSTALRPLLFLATIASGVSADQSDTPSPPRTSISLVERFDQNGDHRLDAKERQNAREFLARQGPQNPPGTQGRPGLVLQNGPTEPAKPGEKINPANIASFPDRGLYDANVVRTVSLVFEDSAWEKELTDFAATDVLIPATLTIDDKVYAGVGVKLRDQEAGNAMYEGYKRALEVVVDYTTPDQAVYGRKRLVLLDASSDATLLHSVLYSHVAGTFIPAPKANFVRLAINGENWGIYVSAEPLDETFISEKFPGVHGTWWTVSPGGNLAYLGSNPDAYRKSYRLQSAETIDAWNALIDLCKALDQTRAADLESELSKRIDIERTLKFLALENALINQDGYSGKDGTYGLYRGADGRFVLIPQDAEMSFRLLEYSEVERQPQRRAVGPRSAKKTDPTDPQTQANANASRSKKDFPKQTATDLAMLLSYSFVNKADTDFDSKLSRDEWLAFARSWFVVMDEDLIGKLNQDQFIEKFRIIVTPASGIDGRTKQSFGKDDPAGMIGRDFFKAMDRNQDGFLTSEEIIATFTQWFPEWASGKPAVITQPALQKGFNTLFSRTTFQADQSLIVSRKASDHLEGEHEFGGKRGGRGAGAGGSVGPLRFLGFGRGNRGGASTLVTYSTELYPLAGLDEADKPLLQKLLLVPAFRQQYLGYVRDIAENWLDWNKLGPIAKQYRDLIAADVEKETHKANSYEHFVQEFDQDTSDGQRDGEAAPSLKNFANERRKFLLRDENVSGAGSGN